MIGISTYCLVDRPLPEALDILSGLTDLIEVMDEGPHLIGDTGLFSGYSADFIIHAPYHGMNIASLFEPIRRASVEVMIDCFGAAAMIGAPVVLHPGYYAWEQEKDAADRQFGKSLSELTAAAEDRSVLFSFENMGDMNFFNLRVPGDLAGIRGSRFTLDVGHANLNRCLPAFLKTPFTHMHLHDNDGRRDSHSTIGDGTIDFPPVLEALRRNGATAVLEVKTLDGVKTSLAALGKM